MVQRGTNTPSGNTSIHGALKAFASRITASDQGAKESDRIISTIPPISVNMIPTDRKPIAMKIPNRSRDRRQNTNPARTPQARPDTIAATAAVIATFR